MREIKLRVYAIGTKEMVYFHNPSITYCQFDSGNAWGTAMPIEKGAVYISKYSDLMQYTGLKDSEGREIYEEDIIKDLFGEIRIIEWCEEEACYKGREISNITGQFTECIWSDEIIKTAVIGNIYENPELLEVPNEFE